MASFADLVDEATADALKRRTKRLADPYDTRVKWHKIKNRGYTQKEGRGDLFNGPRRRH
jgi:hypothetical protein